MAFLATPRSQRADGGLRLHVDTVDDGMVVGDTIVTYGAVTGFNALVIGDVEYEIKPGSVHRIKRACPRRLRRRHPPALQSTRSPGNGLVKTEWV